VGVRVNPESDGFTLSRPGRARSRAREANPLIHNAFPPQAHRVHTVQATAGQPTGGQAPRDAPGDG